MLVTHRAVAKLFYRTNLKLTNRIFCNKLTENISSLIFKKYGYIFKTVLKLHSFNAVRVHSAAYLLDSSANVTVVTLYIRVS